MDSSSDTDNIGPPAENFSEKPPDPPGAYEWGGRAVRYNYARIAARLGTTTDTALAKEISAPVQQVRKQRLRLGIERYSPVKRMHHLLGKLPDRELARRFGVAAATVSSYRKRHGIPPADLKAANAQKRLQSYLESLDKQLES